MTEYIEKAELIKKLCFETAEWYYSPTIKTIKEFPAADVQPVKRGKWIAENRDNRGYADCYTCSHCKSYVYTYTLMKDCEFDFCPNCGADMRGDTE